jgi:hypothetical protein
MKKILLILIPTISLLAFENLPPNAKPGECYKKVIVPAIYEDQKEEVLIRPESKRLKKIPAEYEYQEEKVLIKPEQIIKKIIPGKIKTLTKRVLIKDEEIKYYTSLNNKIPVSKSLLKTVQNLGINLNDIKEGTCIKEYYTPAKYEIKKETYESFTSSENKKIIPAKYQTIKEKVLISEGGEKIITTPAKYKTVTEKILIKNKKREWKKSNCEGENCGVICLTESPEQYKEIRKKVLVEPATTKTITIPPKYKEIAVKKLVQEDDIKSIPVEGKNSTYTIKKKIKEENFSWEKTPNSKPTGLQICKVRIPEQYKILTITEKAPDEVVQDIVPAQFKTIKVRKLIIPETVEEEVIPAVYRTITKKVLIQPSQIKWKKTTCSSR